MKLDEESKGGKLSYNGTCMRCLDLIPKIQETKAQIDKWDYIKPKTTTQKRKQSREKEDNFQIGRKHFQTINLARGEYPQIYKEFMQFNRWKTGGGG